MKILIALNFAVGFILAVSFMLPEETDFALLLGMASLPAFLLLALVNFIFIFKQWKPKRFLALVPFGSYIIASVLFGCLTRWEANLVLRGTPCRPDSFFDEKKKSDLTQIANQALLEYRGKNFAPESYLQAKKYDLKPLFADTNQQIIVFGYYHGRSCFEYLYSKNGSTNLPAANTGYEQPVMKPLGDNWYFRVW